MDAREQQALELEIAAFQGPAMKRARIWLAILGAVYFVTGIWDYIQISEVRERLDRLAAFASTSERTEAERMVDHVALVVVFTIVAGVLQLGLAWWAKKRPLEAFLAACGLFAVHTAILLSLVGPVVLFSEIRILFVIVLAFGLFAALKANRMRRSRMAGDSLLA